MISADRKRTFITGERWKLFDTENFDEFAPGLWMVEGWELAETSQRAALDYCRRLAREIASKRPDKCCCADDVTRALTKMGRKTAIGKAAGAIFRTHEWEMTGRSLLSKRTHNNGRE